MNVYDDFFEGISPEDWEFFACDFLGSQGFEIVSPPARGADGGKDVIVSYQETTYIVSCKHFIHSGRSVTPQDEQSIRDRIDEHGVDGFIGFYSTLVSQGLQNKLDGLKRHSIPYAIFDKDRISNYMPNMNAWVLQKYGLPTFGKTFYLNVPEHEYHPLPCMKCGRDTISDEMIPLSMAGFVNNTSGELEYIYGCKECFGNYCDNYWIEYSQSLYIEQLISWDRFIQDIAQHNKLSNNFYYNYFIYRSALMQRLYPSHLGVHPLSLIQ